MTTDHISSFIVWCSVLILALVPLVFWHGLFFPYTFFKTMVFYVLVEAAVLAWIPLWYLRPEYRLFVTPVSVAVAGYIAIFFVSAAGGIDSSRSVWSEFERMSGGWFWLHLGAFFAVVANILRTERAWIRLFTALVGVSGVVGGIALWQGITNSIAVRQGIAHAALSISTIGNAAYLSSYAVPAVFVACMLAFREKRFTWRVVLYVLIAFVLAGTVIFTQARAGIVGLTGGAGVGMLLFLLFADGNRRTRFFSYRFAKRVIILLLAAGAAVGVVVIAFPDAAGSLLPHQLGQLAEFSIRERTAAGRVLVWQVAWEGWKERPLLGWGPEHFPALFNTYYRPDLYPLEPWFDRAHNFIFDAGTTTGILGLLMYLGMFGSAVYMLVRGMQEGRIPFWNTLFCVSALGAHVAQNLFTFDTVSSLLVVFVILGYSASLRDDTAFLPAPAMRVPRGAWAMCGAGFLLLSILAYAVVVNPMRANAAAHKGWELLRTGGGDDVALAEFEKSISYGTRYSVDARRFAAEYLFEFLKQGGRRPDESLRRLTEYAITKMTENITAEPYNVKWVMYRGELYSIMAVKFDSGFVKLMEDDFMRARELSPGRPRIYLALSEAARIRGDIAAAWENINHVTETVPGFLFGHTSAVVLAVETDDHTREEKELAWLREHGGYGEQALRDVYIKKKRYTDAVSVQKEIVRGLDADPISYKPVYRAVSYARLAALYQLAGDTAHAWETALLVLKLDPAKKSEVEAFLQTLP